MLAGILIEFSAQIDEGSTRPSILRANDALNLKGNGIIIVLGGRDLMIQ